MSGGGLTSTGFQKAGFGALGLLFISIPLSIAGMELAIFGLYLLWAWSLAKGQGRWLHSPQERLVLAFLALAALSAVLAPEPALGLAYFKKLWRFGLPFALLMLLEDRWLPRLLDLWAGSAALIGGYGAWQHWTGVDLFRSQLLQNQYLLHDGNWHAVGIFSHHLTFGAVMMLVFACYLPLTWTGQLAPPRRLFYGLTAALGAYGAYASMGRSIWLGMGAVLVTFGFLRLKKKGIWLVVFLGLFGALALAVKDTQPVQGFLVENPVGARIAKGFNQAANMDRLRMWQAGYRAWGQHPWLGLGPGQGASLQLVYDQVAEETGHKFNHVANVGVHNIFLQTLVDLGILGALPLLLWWFWTWFELYHDHLGRPVLGVEQGLRLGILSGLAGVWVAGFFENNFRDAEVQVAILTLFGLAMWLGRRPPDRA